MVCLTCVLPLLHYLGSILLKFCSFSRFLSDDRLGMGNLGCGNIQLFIFPAVELGVLIKLKDEEILGTPVQSFNLICVLQLQKLVLSGKSARLQSGSHSIPCVCKGEFLVPSSIFAHFTEINDAFWILMGMAVAWFWRAKANSSLGNHEDVINDLNVSLKIETSLSGKGQIESELNKLLDQSMLRSNAMEKPNNESSDYNVTTFLDEHPGGDEILLAATGMASRRERFIWNSRLGTNSSKEMQRIRDHIFNLENLVDELNHENSILYQQSQQLTQSLQQAEKLNQQQTEHIVVLLKQVNILQTLIHQEKKSCDSFVILTEAPHGTFDQDDNEHQRKKNKTSDKFKPSLSNQAGESGKKIQKINHEMIGYVEKGKKPEVPMKLCSYCNRKRHELS
ncbi:hypothetical protein DH2020_020150 [Rehmannia glutinosa]|uniref:Cytochrome b5 heme-binding domain-containing protein n=1 Tax=Rehmannia glutinosa TaxID=99300 RepID=A0ABR0WI75_REHGL